MAWSDEMGIINASRQQMPKAADVKRLFVNARLRHLEDTTADLSRLAKLYDDAILAMTKEVSLIPDERTGIKWTKDQLGVLRKLDDHITNLRTDYNSLLMFSMMSSAQNAAELQIEIEKSFGMPPDPSLIAREGSQVKMSNGDDVVVMFSHKADNAVRTVMERTYKDYLKLPQRMMALDNKTRGIVEDVVKEGLSSGQSGITIADKLMLELGKQGADTPRYMAQRLATTEIATANRVGTIMSATSTGTGMLKHGIIGLRCNLSLMHKGEDICNRYVAGHSYGLSAGVYQPDDVPEFHAGCQCYLTPEMAVVE